MLQKFVQRGARARETAGVIEQHLKRVREIARGRGGRLAEQRLHGAALQHTALLDQLESWRYCGLQRKAA